MIWGVNFWYVGSFFGHLPLLEISCHHSSNIKSGQRQISTSDTDTRRQIMRNNITKVVYSAQTSVDAK